MAGLRCHCYKLLAARIGPRAARGAGPASAATGNSVEVVLIATIGGPAADSYRGGVRLFVADDAWSELTSGAERVIRVVAGDLQQARRTRDRLRGDDGAVAVILDVTVAVAGDVRSAYASLAADDSAGGVRYAGTVSGLAGLIADIETAGVADGVTLVGASPRQDQSELAELGRTVLGLLQQRNRACA
jgi:hypothetical protein